MIIICPLVYLLRITTLFSSSYFLDVLSIFVFCYLGNGTSSISLKNCKTNNPVFLVKCSWPSALKGHLPKEKQKYIEAKTGG